MAFQGVVAIGSSTTSGSPLKYGLRAMPRGLFTDLYELNMAASYIRRDMSGEATFSLFVRALPPGRAFLVAAGLESCLDYLETFSFEDHDLEYLVRLGFDTDSVSAFSEMRFSGEVWAVPEGRIVFAEEPLLEVSAPLAEAQLVETFLLNQITSQTTIASKAARCRIAASDRVGLVEFGFRRTQGIEAGMTAARVSALVGFSATSNVEAARRYGLSPSGTMAHSYVSAFPSEIAAFRAFVEDAPGACTFLVDTYDTLTGVSNAIEVIKQFDLAADAAIRLDSGDLDVLARGARKMLDDAGLRSVRIFLSGSLDEHKIEELVRRGTPFDAAGIGTRLGVSADAPYLDTVYKLVQYAGRPVVKLSTGKETLPGAKQVFRAPGLRDVLGLRSEAVPRGSEPLLERVMSQGRRLGDAPGLEVSRRRFESDFSSLPGALRDLAARPPQGAQLTPALEELTDEVRKAAREPQGEG